jgi:stearoyl-CoA desaturase (delta-9 desaturase)
MSTTSEVKTTQRQGATLASSTQPARVGKDAVEGEPKDGRLEAPQTTQPITIFWLYATPLIVVHLLALLAFIPWMFSWSGLVIAVLGHLTFGMLGITVGYHRLLTHQGFTCPKWFEHTLAILGICTLQDSPARWVAIHRMHHKHSDEQPDPHSPLVNFFWGHVGWLLVVNRDHNKTGSFERYARDLLRQPFYLRLERNGLWLGIYFLHALLFVVAGFVVGFFTGGTLMAGVQLGVSWFVWGVVVRTVFVLNGTWAVNSIGHVWGYQNYDTGDHSRNNWFVALIAHGEGWHNNHHADQRSARHGHRWWEYDMSWWVIVTLEKLGLIHDVVRPKEQLDGSGGAT